jgi:LPS sulfotransferase NodH
MKKNMLIRDAFGISETYEPSEAEIESLRNDFRGIAPYVILFTARSGSTFLTHEVAATGRLSVPNEWFSWLYIREDTNKNGGTPVDFLRRLVSGIKSPGGIFGVETNRLMLELFEDVLPLERIFPRRPRWFVLRRRNLVSQSISNYIADESRVFHSYQLNAGSDKKIDSVQYDSEKLKGYIKKFVEEEIWFFKYLRKKHVVPVELFYEDVVSDPKSAAMRIANVMGVWLPHEYVSKQIENPMKKLANNKNVEYEKRFRDENSLFLDEILKIRPNILEPASNM